MPRAGFFPRAAAFLIDLGVFLVVAHLLAWADVLLNQLTNVNAFGPVSLGGGAAFLVAYSLLDVFAAGTPGKKVMGLVVAADDGQPARIRALLGRWAVKMLPATVLAIAGALLSMTLTPYPTVRMADYVRDGVAVLGFADAVIGLALAAFVSLGCFRVARPGRGCQAYHDVMSGTAVYPAAQVRAARAFEPVLAARAAPAASAQNESGRTSDVDTGSGL